jgi:TonB family protein
MTDKSVRKAMKSWFWIVLAAFCVAGPVRGLQTEAPPAVQSAALTDSINRAFQLIADGKFKEARAELERSQTLAAGPCGECLLGMSHIYASEKDWKRTKKSVQQALPLLTAPGVLARAYDQLGTAAFQSRDLDEAEDAFRRAVSSGGAWGMLGRYNLAELLLTRQRWAEAVEAARTYLKDAGPGGTVLDQARIVLCQARSHQPDDPLPSDSEIHRTSEGEGVVRPEIILKTTPSYPEESRATKEHGTVIVEAIIDREGCVTHVRPLKSRSHDLTEAAQDAARRWVFRPATRAGDPVQVYYVLTVNFQIRYGPPVSPPGAHP